MIVTLILVLTLVLYGLSAHCAHAEIKVLDKPLWIFPGQQFRIALEQPAGSGQLDVDVPGSLEMFDQWPKDSIQRFYFRAVRSGDATLRFHGSAGELEIPLAVIPWRDVFKPREFANIALPRIWPMDDLEYRELKTSRTCHDEAELSARRSSGAKLDEQAEAWLSMSDEDIFNIVPGSDVPRTCLIVLGGYEDAMGKGCPVCGMALYEGRSGFYPWIFDPEGHPWKVGCPSCGNWFPSNDWANGDMRVTWGPQYAAFCPRKMVGIDGDFGPMRVGSGGRDAGEPSAFLLCFLSTSRRFGVPRRHMGRVCRAFVPRKGCVSPKKRGVRPLAAPCS